MRVAQREALPRGSSGESVILSGVSIPATLPRSGQRFAAVRLSASVSRF